MRQPSPAGIRNAQRLRRKRGRFGSNSMQLPQQQSAAAAKGAPIKDVVSGIGGRGRPMRKSEGGQTCEGQEYVSVN